MGQRTMDLNIICFLWKGDRWTDGHQGEEYVNKLYRGVQRNLSIPHRFICLTDREYPEIDKNIEQFRIHTPLWNGCMPKISMYNPDLGLTGQVFSLDIDLVITGSLDDMCSYRGDFCTRSKFRQGLTHLVDGDIVGFKISPKIVKKVWEPFITDPKAIDRYARGRERYYYRKIFEKDHIDFWQILYPGQMFSYKNHLNRGQALPEDARIVSFHGRPRPHEVLHINWIKENWI